jgi:equilibrative nucleoside transporter 1/2/3
VELDPRGQAGGDMQIPYGKLPEETVEPKDTYNLAYILLFLNGLGQLFPWNVFITAANYFGTRLCDSTFHDTFLNFFGITFGACNCTGLVIALLYQHKVSQDTRAVAPLVVNTLVFSATTALVLVEPSELPGPPFFIITLVLVGLSGSCNAFLSGGAFGLAAQLPPIYTGAIMGGQGFAGITVALTALAAALASPDAVPGCATSKYSDVKWGAFAYFLVSVAVLLGCLIGYLVLVRLEFVRYHLEKAKAPKVEKELIQSESDQISKPLISKSHRPIWPTLLLTRRMAISVYFVFALTLMLFPTVTVQIDSTSSSHFFKNTFFLPFSFVNFNFCDFVGRVSAGAFRISPATQDRLWIICALRLLFIPAFLFCSTGYSRENGFDFFGNDVWPILFMAVFAASNGLLSSLLMMYGPQRAPPENMDIAGTIMVTFLTFGLFTGSCLSFTVAPLAHP